jgi:hypothetical protein
MSQDNRTIRPDGLYAVNLEDLQPYRDTQQEYGQIDPNRPQDIDGDEFAYSGRELIKSINNVQNNPQAALFGVDTSHGMVSPRLSDYDLLTLDLSKVACRVTRVEMVDGVVRGDAELIGPRAESVRTLTYGKDYTFGARAMIQSQEKVDGTTYVRVCNLITWDIVAPPQLEGE